MAGTTPGHSIGATTVGASGAGATGAGLGAAIGAIIVHTLGANGLDVREIEWAIVIVCSSVVAYAAALLGGKFSPTNKATPGPAVEVSGGPVTVETSGSAPVVSEAASGAHSGSQPYVGRHRAES